MPSPARVRIAPSPTGDPHVGTAYTGLFNWLLAHQTGGQFILRIEDTDRQRSTKESEEVILRSLRWLGLDWDEGPGVDGPFGPYRQSERSAIYREHVDGLVAAGAAFPCFCDAERLAQMREKQKAEKLTLGYDGACRAIAQDEAARRISSGESHVVRLKVDKTGRTSFEDALRGTVEFDNSNVDDQVLLKSDGFPTYHLANVVDDHLMEITHVLRAEEWISSTPKHVLLYQAFGWQPPVFCHLPLLRNADKSKISKRKNPTSLEYYREAGYLPEAMVNFLALMGFSPGGGEGEEVYNLDELKERFRLESISLGGPVFDLTKLDWLNGAWIRRLSAEDLTGRILDYLPEGHPADAEFVSKVIPLVRERLKTLGDFEKWTGFFFEEDVHFEGESFRRTKLDAAEMASLLEQAVALLEAHEGLDAESDEAGLRDLAKELGIKVGSFFMTLRIAVTGQSTTPPLFGCIEVMGKDRALARIRKTIRYLREGDGEPVDL